MFLLILGWYVSHRISGMPTHLALAWPASRPTRGPLAVWKMLVVSFSRPRDLLAALLCLCSWMTLTVEGLTITVNNGQISVSNDNMMRISVYDFEFVNSNSDGDTPVPCAFPDPEYVAFTSGSGFITRGWSGRRANEDGYRVHYLWRRRETPEEGYINCHMIDDTNPVLGLYVLYSITGVTAAIEVETGTSTFRVRCTSTGGRALNMAVSGPNGYNSDISTNIEPIGTPLFLRNDRYTARTDVISSGMVGDEFQCNVTSVDSMTDVVTVEVATAPTLDSLVQTALTAVRVAWSSPSETSITGHRVRYSLLVEV
ncbi:hypothetical protein GBAR_LOCUS4104 [Geodia barretti]|uniref:Uncharacterized protein n=1 Tax=Geodia barretti TaxID=519541 RepID=A0AA35W5Y8_GEOBA|nr:hypothetical protein GBAR_LOCUS4104 [Geodia barretti]